MEQKLKELERTYQKYKELAESDNRVTQDERDQLARIESECTGLGWELVADALRKVIAASPCAPTRAAALPAPSQQPVGDL